MNDIQEVSFYEKQGKWLLMGLVAIIVILLGLSWRKGWLWFTSPDSVSIEQESSMQVREDILKTLTAPSATGTDKQTSVLGSLFPSAASQKKASAGDIESMNTALGSLTSPTKQ